MTNLMLRSAVVMLFLLCVQSGATPIAESQITCDLANAAPTFVYGEGGGSASSASSIPSQGDFHIDIDGINTVDQSLSGDGTFSASSAGASVSAQAANGLISADAKASTSGGIATAHSDIQAYLAYDVSNVSSFSLSMNTDAFLALSTDNPGDFATGFWSADLGFYTFDGISFGPSLYVAPIGFSQGVFDGDKFNSGTVSSLLSLSYEFSTPYSGTLIFQNFAEAYSEAQAPSASVPEPSEAGLIIVGMAMIGLIRRSAKTAKA